MASFICSTDTTGWPGLSRKPFERLQFEVGRFHNYIAVGLNNEIHLVPQA